ncbi:MAG: hypothetical protein WAQ28_16260 [Bacteroidia bacterium]
MKPVPRQVKKHQDKELKKDIAASYDHFKVFEGQQYTGMKIGRSHKWHYDAGVWKEKKVTPEKWEIEYSVNKRRAGKAPDGSGVPVGTEYHWYILSHQYVRKLDANTYTTSMIGFKHKIAHKRADKDKWSVSEKTQKKKLIAALQQLIDQLESQEQLPLQPETETKGEKIQKRKAIQTKKELAETF